MRLAAVALLVASLVVAPSAAAKEEKPAEVDSPAKVKIGQTALVKPGKGMNYFLRVPKAYDAKNGARLVVFLHGSNMNGLSYVRSFEAKHWAEDDILCCPNGEQGSDPFGSNNFTFDSAPLVADVTDQVKKTFKTTISYVGGHSQGGFLTYSVILLNPDLFQGALPMSGDCWSQNEPNLWEDKPDVAKKQHEIAIAVLHSKNDPVVKFEQGQHAYDVFRDEGWQKLRFFAPERAAHMFMVFPVDEMLDWLDAMNGRSEEKTSKLLEKWAKDGEWGWVLAAAKASKSGGAKWVKQAEDAATKAAPAMTDAMKGKPADWIPKWIEFWRVYGGTDAAKPLVDDYLKKRAEQRDAGQRLFNEAFGLIRADKRPDAKTRLEQILVDAPYSYEGYYAAKWLADWK
jgi:poly(3-hydroxybutyrate) depolymerase